MTKAQQHHQLLSKPAQRGASSASLSGASGARGFASRPKATTATVAAVASAASSSSPTAQFSSARPRLVLLIVVDQLRYDYLERFGDLFVANGFKRLMRDGASWAEAYYDHMPTYTAPGHAAVATGTWPAENGIIGNEWYDREAGKNVTSVSDDKNLLLGGDPAGKASSPRRLFASTLGDELRLATGGRAKVIGVSIKDRSAILPVGRYASAAYWFNATGQAVSSNYYFANLPAWVTSFNEGRPADKFFGQRWERLLPEAEYVRRAGIDAPAWEQLGPNISNTFPHSLSAAAGRTAPDKDFYSALDFSPFSNDLLINFAERALEHEKLGADDDTDLLALGLSANDYVGHRFGPYSQEVMDVTLRTDRQIATLLDFIQARVGLQNTVVVVTADHGVAPVPEHAAALNLGGGRIKGADVLKTMRAAISGRYNQEEGLRDTGDNYIQAFVNGNVYFNLAALQRDGIKRKEIERIAGEAAMSVPGMTRYFTRTQLEAGSVMASDAVARRALNGFHPRRSGEVILVSEPYKFLADSATGTTHGSPYSYDTHVPLIIMGKGITSGRYTEAATPADIAPTLAALLRVNAPSNTTGRVLTEGINTPRHTPLP